MSNYFAGERFALREAFENRLPHFFANGNKGFSESGTIKLASKQQQVIEQNVAY